MLGDEERYFGTHRGGALSSDLCMYAHTSQVLATGP